MSPETPKAARGHPPPAQRRGARPSRTMRGGAVRSPRGSRRSLSSSLRRPRRASWPARRRAFGRSGSKSALPPRRARRNSARTSQGVRRATCAKAKRNAEAGFHGSEATFWTTSPPHATPKWQNRPGTRPRRSRRPGPAPWCPAVAIPTAFQTAALDESVERGSPERADPNSGLTPTEIARMQNASEVHQRSAGRGRLPGRNSERCVRSRN